MPGMKDTLEDIVLSYILRQIEIAIYLDSHQNKRKKQLLDFPLLEDLLISSRKASIESFVNARNRLKPILAPTDEFSR